MSSPKAQPIVVEDSPPKILDTTVKYSALLTWLVLAAGLSRISGFLHSLSVPTESGFFYLPAVFSYGGSSLLSVALSAAVGLIAPMAFGKESPRLAKFLGWVLPSMAFIMMNKHLLSISCPISLRMYCGGYLLVAVYVCVAIANTTVAIPRDKVLLASIR